MSMSRFTKRDTRNCGRELVYSMIKGDPRIRVAFASQVSLLLEERRVRSSHVFRVGCLGTYGVVSAQVPKHR